MRAPQASARAAVWLNIPQQHPYLRQHVNPLLVTASPAARLARLLIPADACKAVLMRSGDPEESIQDMVAKVFHRWVGWL